MAVLFPSAVGRPLVRGGLRRTAVPLLVGAMAGCAPSSVPAQAIPDEPSCQDCTIHVETAAELGHILDDGMIGSPTTPVYVMRNGGYASTDLTDPGVFRFYGPDGSYLHSLEMHGQGPGEFMGVADLFRLSDGYLIYDITLGRLSWVGPDFEYQRSMSLSAIRVAMLPDESGVVVNGLAGNDVAAGHVLRVVRFDGSDSPSFGGDGRPIDLRVNRTAHHRVMAVDRDGGIWTSRLNRYELVRYSRSGDTLAVFTRTAGLFPPTDRFRNPVDLRSGPPTAHVKDMIVDSGGLLWVSIRVPDENWEEAVRTQSETRFGAPDGNKMWDNVIEVIDPAVGQLLARTTVPWALQDVEMTEASGQVLLRYVAEKESGFLGATILRFTLDRGN